MFSAYDSNNDGALSWDEWKVYVESENIMNQNRGDDFWMEQHMNYNYIDSNRNNLIEKQEYEFYLKEIGLTPPKESDAPVESMMVVPNPETPLDVTQKIELQNGLSKAFTQVTGGLIILLVARRAFKKINKPKVSQNDKFSKELNVWYRIN